MSNYTVVTKKQADKDGFVIEGEVGFLYNLGCTVAILGWDSMNKVWRFDTVPDPEGDVWSFVEVDLAKAMERAEALSIMMQAYNDYQIMSGADPEGLFETSIRVMVCALEGGE